MIELKSARYKGVEFLFDDMPTTGGNRLIKFNFPGSDKQAIERQGKVPRTFNMTAVIPHENYYQVRDNLLRVLDDGERGTLTHPTFGDIENVINGVYTLTERLSELGRAQIVIPFEVDDALGVPRQSGALAAQVQAQSDVLNAQLTADLAAGYDVGLNFSGNFTDALEDLNNVSKAFAQTTEFAEPVAENIAAFRSSINTFAGSAGDLIQAPADLAAGIDGLFADLGNLYSTPGTLFGAVELLFSFGSTDPEIFTTTVGLTQRKQNRDLIRANMRVQALSYNYLNAAERTYTTTDELDQAQQDLEAQYLDARDNQLLTNEAREELDRLRVQGQKTLDEARVTTSATITIETPLKPLSVLVYEYYGSTDLVDIVAELNNIKQNAFVSGSIRIPTV